MSSATGAISGGKEGGDGGGGLGSWSSIRSFVWTCLETMATLELSDTRTSIDPSCYLLRWKVKFEASRLIFHHNLRSFKSTFSNIEEA